MSAFDRYLQALLDRAADEARSDGSATVDAHHLLLALAAAPTTAFDGAPATAFDDLSDDDDAARRVLAAAGLDRDAVRAALDREFAHSLRAVGVSPDTDRLPPPSPGTERPRLGASTRLALERSFGAARKKDQTSAHLLSGILAAEVGTVPRALALSGVDRERLAGRARAAADRRHA
ncbi:MULTISPECIES: Clp protease N-terminal domain-containing protein [Kitasatospora]|uniref:Clp R domain-containing protein n=1 Tax=Kitasatospora setae (strain ATCC 33774 / DSM 43861 / JCM 3304 / KCC A-0304 / NBRC 14216 / KM-6054) TaxID=452652 RepID=E4N4D0_KITSK|nr:MULTISPECIES: Clp protease N-terminal domain-containing protein [Kitasatospora]BAJ26061.1 hypothetical protein KSE_02110 [Kitasatospora setae KM-6054]